MSTEHLARMGEPFPEPSWSLIDRCQELDSSGVRSSLDVLFRKYWNPIYSYIYRNWTRNADEAKDLTQGFFLAFLERDFLASVQADRGRFRSFVLAALRNFLLNHKRAARARKRSPEGGLVSLEAAGGDAAARPIPDAAQGEDPFDQDWKKAVLETVLAELRRHAAAKGRDLLVDLLVARDLEPPPEGKPSYEALAASRGLTVHQVRNGLHWVRGEFMAILRREIEEQVAFAEDYDREVAALFGSGG